MPLTHRETLKVLEAAVSKAEELQARVAIAIVDEYADLVAMSLLDTVQGARRRFLPKAAQGKAMAVTVWFGRPSAELIERGTAPGGMMASRAFDNQLMYERGAVPIKRGDELVGAIGVGGAPAGQDEEIAAAGAAALGG
jgi:uncharacterized protein GlcG (DUF336 family)